MHEGANNYERSEIDDFGAGDDQAQAEAKQHYAEEHESGVGAISHPNGNRWQDDPDDAEGLAAGSTYGESGSHQGSETMPYGRSSHKKAHGHGRDAEGAFGEEQASEDQNQHSEYSDKAIEKRELGGRD